MQKPLERRKSRRRGLKPTRIFVKQRWFDVHDIGNDGIGLVLEGDDSVFFVGERIDAIPLPLDSGTVYLKGVVSHLSSTLERRICGIRFLFEGDEFDAVLRFQRQCTAETEPEVPREGGS